MSQEIRATILGLITTIIGFIAIYYPEQRMLIISLYLTAFVGYIIYSYLNRIEEHDKKINELEKSFKISEDLIQLRVNIENLKRGLK